MAVTKRKKKKQIAQSWLDGQLLIAMPSMSDRFFARSVIYMCAHSPEGAMGLVVNQRADNITFEGLLQDLGVVDTPRPKRATKTLSHTPVQMGGPVDTSRGFVLHSADYCGTDSTTAIDAAVSLTATLDILKAMAEGRGPNRAILALGYACWSPGQLESEILANGWISCPADLDLVFGSDLEGKYERALSKIGINPGYLVNACGHA